MFREYDATGGRISAFPIDCRHYDSYTAMLPWRSNKQPNRLTIDGAVATILYHNVAQCEC